MKLRNSLAILCSAAFCFALTLTGCGETNHKNPEGTTWTVTFDPNGGTAVPSQTVKDGEKAVKPTNPTKEGYSFVNWYEDSSAVTPFDFSIAITADWTLYAGWQKSDTPIPPDPPQPTTYNYYINIGGVETGLESVNKDSGDPENLVANYHASISSVTAGQAISFRNKQSETVKPGSDAEDDTNKNNISGDYDNGFTIHNDATNVDVYFKEWQDGYSFWITGYQGGVVPPTPTAYSATIGSTTVSFEKQDNEPSDPSNLVAKYKGTVASVTAGAEITFYNGSEVIRPGSDAEDAQNKNNINGSWAAGYTIHNDATNVDVWLKVWNDGYSFWITGYEKGQSQSVTYTCTGLPDWITNDGCVIFVWAWGNSGGGSWYEATFINNGSALTFEVDDELNGFLLARCVSGTTQPDWSIKSGNNAGRIYNKTDDIACTSGTYSYVCSTWYAYNG